MAYSYGRLFKLPHAILMAGALLFMGATATAQGDVIPSSVDVRMIPGDNSTQLKIQIKTNTTEPFGGVLSALTLTIRYDANSGLALGGGPTFCDDWSGFSPSPVVVNDGIAYRTYNGFGISRLDDPEFDGGCDMTIPANTWFTVKTIQVGGTGCGEFTLGNDDYTDAENRSYYISMNGWDVTGVVEGGPITAGDCGEDCLGVAGGTALPGAPCDDNDPLTTNDIWTVDCECVGTPQEDWDCPDLEANFGDACDDGDDDTENDMIDTNCECHGTPIIVWDCPDLQANFGDACDDGDDDTENDMIDTNCECHGTPIIVWDCPDLQANFGDACDDGDDDTENDMIDTNCECHGTPIIVWDCPDLQANFGDACDDGDDDTENDMIDTNCECHGTPIVTWDCPDLQANFGDACDDGNANTINDVITDECICAGEVPDGIRDQGAAGTLIGLYPNPNRDGQVTLIMEGLGVGMRDVLITVVDASGKRVFGTTTTAHGTLQYGMDLSGRVSQGLYAVNVLIGDRQFTARLVIQ